MRLELLVDLTGFKAPASVTGDKLHFVASTEPDKRISLVHSVIQCIMDTKPEALGVIGAHQSRTHTAARHTTITNYWPITRSIDARGLKLTARLQRC